MAGSEYVFAYGALSELVRQFLAGRIDADELRRLSERIEFESITKTQRERS
jgi:hypothetical protein